MYAWVLVVAVFNNSPPLVVPGIADRGACEALHNKLAAARYVPAAQRWGTVGISAIAGTLTKRTARRLFGSNLIFPFSMLLF